MFDLGKLKNVTRIATQGKAHTDDFVEEYRIQVFIYVSIYLCRQRQGFYILYLFLQYDANVRGFIYYIYFSSMAPTAGIFSLIYLTIMAPTPGIL